MEKYHKWKLERNPNPTVGFLLFVPNVDILGTIKEKENGYNASVLKVLKLRLYERNSSIQMGMLML